VARDDVGGLPRRVDAPFSALAFKVQANMDPSHRDRIAFVRVCSGRFERGMVVTHGPTGKPFATKYAHSVFGQERDTIEDAWPGDIVGFVNATDVTVGDALYLDPPVEFPRLPEFAPEHFVVARVRDTARFKQFRRGVAQLDEEGVVQVLRDQDLGDQAPMLAAVGPMQFEVAAHRLEHEFGAPAELSATSWTVARRTDESSTPTLRGLQGVAVYGRADGTRYALFESPYWLARVEADHPDLTLEKLVAEGTVG
jgi:peptide chain release factor 3